MGNPVLVMAMKRPRACTSVGSDQVALSGPREEMFSSRRALSLVFSEQ